MIGLYLRAGAAGLFMVFAGAALPAAAAQRGMASFYASEHHGKRTASGERYNKHAMTAAHRTAPFGSRLKVTHVRTGRSIIVRVNDRGPFVRGRVVDVSYSAARALGMVGSGVAPVTVARVE